MASGSRESPKASSSCCHSLSFFARKRRCLLFFSMSGRAWYINHYIFEIMLKVMDILIYLFAERGCQHARQPFTDRVIGYAVREHDIDTGGIARRFREIDLCRRLDHGAGNRMPGDLAILFLFHDPGFPPDAAHAGNLEPPRRSTTIELVDVLQVTHEQRPVLQPPPKGIYIRARPVHDNMGADIDIVRLPLMMVRTQSCRNGALAGQATVE